MDASTTITETDLVQAVETEPDQETVVQDAQPTWIIILFIFIIVILLGAITALVLVLKSKKKKGKFNR